VNIRAVLVPLLAGMLITSEYCELALSRICVEGLKSTKVV